MTSRPPVGAAARRQNIDRLLVALARSDAQMQTALAAFAPNFDFQAFQYAWMATDPEERNRALLVRGNLDDIHNMLVKLITTSVKLARQLGQIGPDAPKDPYEALAQLKLLTRPERNSLDLTLATRNESQHAYEHLQARQVHAAVLAQRKTAPGLIARLGRWVTELPVTS
ncbi:hypothetical protein [Baekduia sp.]|jgi:hypothetical protein|uniref:hypothetical protein n=1 Tax=Baekduia sp. TaxID=2600305 RepID=UPI002E0097AA|nr:hypothetical protein [Baekduia sp.]